MKLAVIGSGAVGCYYGARLARSGHEVHFLMRRDWDAVQRNGLQINSPEGSFHLERVHAHGDPQEIGPVDLVLCALKATAIEAAEALIRPCVGPQTRIVAMMNGLGIEERFAEWFEPQQIFGGLAFVCINRGEPGVVHHYGYGRVAFGHLLGDLQQAQEIAQLFADAGFVADVRPSLRQARWEKLMWNIPFSTLTITAGGVSTQEIMDDPGLAEMARRLIVEAGQAGNADGCCIDIDANLQKMMANTVKMGRYRPSMLIDYENKLPLEVEAILGEPVRRAAKLSIPVPMIEAQYWLASFLDKLNRGELKIKD